MLTEMRDTVPLIMKADGIDPADATKEDWLNTIDKIREAADSGQIRRFTGNDYTKDLANGDACLAFGFSADIIQASKRAEDAKKPFKVDYAIPAEGAQLWIDAWVIPADAPHVDAAYKFLDFVLRPDIAALNSNYIGYANAVPASKPHLDPAVRDDPAIYPPEEIRERFYTVSPPDRAYERKRTRAWTRVTTGQ